MARGVTTATHDMVKLKGDHDPKEVFIQAFLVDEGLSKLTETRVELKSKNSKQKPEDFLGKRYEIEMEAANDSKRKFFGTCISVEYMGTTKGFEHFGLDIRPWPWFLTQSSNTRIFQEMTTPQIIKKVFDDAGFSDYKDRLAGSYEARVYTVQYSESDFDFVCRLMEEVGIYFYFTHTGSKEELVLADDLGSHDPIKETPKLEYKPRTEKTRRDVDVVFEWAGKERVTTGKISLVDYDFTKSNTKLDVQQSIAKGKHSHKNYERYDMDSHFDTSAIGESRARARIQGHAHQAQRCIASTSARTMAAGATFKLDKHPIVGSSKNDFLVLSAKHYFEAEPENEDEGKVEGMVTTSAIEFPDGNDMYICQLECAQKTEPYRPPLVTPWPDLSGLHTAVVTGPSGEEIHTDQYGRIKVQFHWDRDGKKDDNTTCWVRTVMPWTGKGWGMVAIPRIGQEVIIQFERGNPDRPICTGMVYHDVNQLPYKLPDNKTQSGIKTNSSKGGGGFHELLFEDKKDAEFVRFQSEKDYIGIIKNNADITIGLEKKDKGDLTQTIHRNKTETLNTGDHTFTVKDGNQTIAIKKDHVETIEGKSTTTVTDDTSLTVKAGNLSYTVDSGDETITVKQGNHSTKVSAGKMTMEAAQKIELKCGGSTITMTPSKITVKAAQIEIKGDMTTKIDGGISTDVTAGAMVKIQGGMVKVN